MGDGHVNNVLYIDGNWYSKMITLPFYVEIITYISNIRYSYHSKRRKQVMAVSDDNNVMGVHRRRVT
jgi:hypothetical protein